MRQPLHREWPFAAAPAEALIEGMSVVEYVTVHINAEGRSGLVARRMISSSTVEPGVACPEESEREMLCANAPFQSGAASGSSSYR